MSPRPKRNRRISRPPIVKGFEPMGVRSDSNGSVELNFEEYESLRLTDYELHTHDKAAEKMNVSRPTFTRIYENARRKIARAFVESKSILITGGNIEFEDNWYECLECTAVFKKEMEEKADSCEICGSDEIEFMNENIVKGRGRIRSRGADTNDEVYCVCPKCSKRIPHEAGVPCRSILCPECNVSLFRENSINHLNLMNKKKGNSTNKKRNK